MFAFCGRLGRQFLRIEECAKPWVAAVAGTALGGGLELAMACRARLVDTTAGAQIGLPEIKLGLLPGAGGTQRLPRLVGLALGLDMLLSGRSIDPDAAVSAGLFEAAPSGVALLDAARARLHALRTSGPYVAEAKFAQARLDCPPDDEASVREIAHAHRIDDATLRDYPAYRTIIRCVLGGAGLDLAAGTSLEMTRFLDLMYDPVAGNMISTLFIERQRVEKAASARGLPRPVSLRHGQLGPAAGDWPRLLARSGISTREDPSIGAGRMVLEAEGDLQVPIVVRCVGAQATRDDEARAAPVLLLSPRSPYGRVVEIITGTHADAVGALRSLAASLRCLPLVTAGEDSLLDALALAGEPGGDAPLHATALVAAKWAAARPDADLRALDVVSVLGGLAPAFSGGPLTYAWQHWAEIGQALADALGESAGPFEQRMKRAFGK
ncbi:MAG: enoyl-CoA hydratase-related protein [Burkholderiaceae bacterium]